MVNQKFNITFYGILVFLLLITMAYLGYKVDAGAMNENVLLFFGLVFIVTIAITLIVDSWYIKKRCKR